MRIAVMFSCMAIISGIVVAGDEGIDEKVVIVQPGEFDVILEKIENRRRTILETRRVQFLAHPYRYERRTLCDQPSLWTQIKDAFRSSPTPCDFYTVRIQVNEFGSDVGPPRRVSAD